jgi:hypothetical protein
MRIDRLLRRNTEGIVATCPQEGHVSRKGTDIMEHTYIDIDAHIREANRARSEAMGAILSSGWHRLAGLVMSLVHHQTPGRHAEVRSIG